MTAMVVAVMTMVRLVAAVRASAVGDRSHDGGCGQHDGECGQNCNGELH
jgi:hypothetical protein